MIKSPLKWAGGKSSLIPTMTQLWEAADRWVDLFAGGCSLPLAIAPKHVLVNDTNSHLIDFWKHLKNIGHIATESFQNDSDFYYSARESFNANPTPELFYYLNRSCFNGLCRYNKKGGFNVPFGKYKNINYKTDWQPYHQALSSWDIQHGCYSKVEVLETDFVFADPPYDDSFVEYSADGFTWEDQEKLAHWLQRSPAKQVVTTNKATDRILELYHDLGFQIQIIEMPRRIAANGDRKPAQEMLATLK
jgi:DNA adenine methylase